MSALPPKADIRRRGFDVRFVPIAEISDFAASKLKDKGQWEARCAECASMLTSSAKVERARRKSEMTASTHRYHGYELVLQRKDDDSYQVTIFDPKGKRAASTGMHLERQGALSEASQYINHLLAKESASFSTS